MKHDPIVEEIHKARERVLRECAGDLEKFMDRLKAAEDQDHGRLVSLETLREKRQRERSPLTRR